MKFIYVLNGIEWNELTNLIIEHAISLNSPIAMVENDRKINYENVDNDVDNDVMLHNIDIREYINDFTDEEIKAGTEFIKNYLNDNNLYLLERYLKIILKGKELLDNLKDIKIKLLNINFNNEIDKLKKPNTPSYEIDTWEQQKIEAYSILENPDSETPLIDVLADERQIDRIELANKIIKKSSEFQNKRNYLIAKRQSILDIIENSKSIKQLENIKLTFGEV